MLDRNFLQPYNKDLWQVFDLDRYFISSDFHMLDFGCNNGNFIKSAIIRTKDRNLKFQPNNYRGIDLNKYPLSVIFDTHRDYADRVVFYDRYHPSYNPGGRVNQLPSQNFSSRCFDLVVAYSVFSHSSVEDLGELLLDLKTLLKLNGSILFTVFLQDQLDSFYRYVHQANNLSTIDSTRKELVEKKFEKFIYWLNLQNSVVDHENFKIQSLDSLFTFYKDVDTVLNLFSGLEYLGRPEKQIQHLFRLAA